jgi:hypothetical protein
VSDASGDEDGDEDTEIDLEALVDETFPRARSRYSPYLLIRRPLIDADGTILARIDLASRSILLGGLAILDAELQDSLEALIAHVIGHHVGFPGSPVAHARLLLLERSFLRKLPRTITIPLYELLIDERLVRTAGGDTALEDDLCRILARRVEQAPDDTLFLFQCAVAEEMWQRAEGEILGAAKADFDADFPHHRLDARLVAQNVFGYAPDLTLQYLYFASIAFPYAFQSSSHGQGAEGGTISNGPTAEEWAEALVPKKTETDAIQKAIDGKFFPDKLEQALKNQDVSQRAGGVPGQGGDKSRLVTEVMAAHYRREAERHLFTPPPIATWSEALVPTTVEEWEPGEPIADIDWLTTLRLRGELLGTAMPLVRERIADEEGFVVPSFQGRTEIYLDVSGSMPDPTKELNAMTLAAQVLVAGTLRAGGAARALLYSTTHEKAWEFCRSESILSRFLMRYIGGGTDFPFDVLAASVESERNLQPIRVIITDSDFDANYDSRSEHAHIFKRAAERSPALVLLLHAPNRERIRRYSEVGVRVVAVQKLSDFPIMAAALAHSLFDPGSSATMAEDVESVSPVKKENRHVFQKKRAR